MTFIFLCVFLVMGADIFAAQSSSVFLDTLLRRASTTNPPSSTTPAVWTGKYFPSPPPTSTSTPLTLHAGVAMGVDPKCDDSKTHLEVDWDNSPIDFTCYHPNKRILPDFDTPPLLEIEHVPKLYSAAHYCMNETIVYQNPVPTFGPHRPSWPRYGEFKYLPVQRWLHSLEHGAVVMLYHPCAQRLEIERLRRLVVSCLFRHIISPSKHLKLERPLALVTWGKRLTMSTVNVEIVKDFIKQNALRGPEKTSRDGQYEKELIKAADIVSDTEDVDICPVEKLKNLSFIW